MELHGNTVLITGGASGIGLALAEAFLDAGSEVIVCGRRAEKLEEARARRPALHVRTCDVADPEACRALATWTKERFPRLNVLVNNAGIQRDLDLLGGEAALDAGESELRTNLEAPIRLSALFAPQLAGKPQATLVHVTSGLAFVPMAKMPIYCATKAALHAFALAQRHQLASVGVRVVELIPPAVDTDLNPEGRKARGGFKAGLTAEAFVRGAMAGLASGALEIGYGMSEGLRRASRDELDAAFVRMNAR